MEMRGGMRRGHDHQEQASVEGSSSAHGRAEPTRLITLSRFATRLTALPATLLAAVLAAIHAVIHAAHAFIATVAPTLIRLRARIAVQIATRKRWMLARLAVVVTLLTLLAGPGSPLVTWSATVAASPLTSAGAGGQWKKDTGKPNTYNPKASPFTFHPYKTPIAPAATSGIAQPQPLLHTPGPMSNGTLTLTPGKAVSFLGSDGHLEVDAPADAVTAADLAAAGGSIALRITQIAPASGSNAGGSGHVSLGTYLIQAVDANGVLLAHGLRKPLTLRYHYGARESALDLSHVFTLFNGSLPVGVQVAPTSMTTTPSIQAGGRVIPGGTVTFTYPVSVTPVSIGLGNPSTQTTTLNTQTHQLIVTAALSSPSSSMSWNTDSPVAVFGKPDPFSADLSGGGLTGSYPLDVPTGPGGLTPPITLSYGSAGVSAQHNPQGAAGWVGEGWNLSLGSISWAEHDVTSDCISTCGHTWEDSWQLSDPFGASAELIPPNINVSTFYDDSPNNYCGADGNANNATSYPCPIQWQTTPATGARVYAYIGPVRLPDAAPNASCFRVFLPNGIMEEFGCTADSLEYYYTPGMGDYISTWNLDLITDRQGDQIHLTYQQDAPSLQFSNGSHTTVRDAVLSTITWDSPGCLNAQTACSGSAWAPQMQVVFDASHSPASATYGSKACNTGASLRCDDPLDLSTGGNLPAPQVQSDFVLNDARVQVRASGTGSWNTLRAYQFSYAANGPTTITDPVSGLSESVAGSLTLSTFQQVGDQLAALMYSGMDNNATTSYAYMKVFDFSTQSLVIQPSTTLTYWVYPQSSATAGGVSGSNSSCVAIDMIFTDGSDLRDSGAVDQHGVRVHPAMQCGHLQLDQWNQVVSNIGQWVSGKTLLHLDVAYDQGANTGGYRGYVDDISLTAGSTTQFATGFEGSQPQPTWTNTVDIGFGAEGGLVNIGGYCCGLSGPEMGVRTEMAHGSLALPPQTFSYTPLDQVYEDSSYAPRPAAGCGFSWNTGNNGSGCVLWATSYAGNDQYLATADNGMGQQTAFTWNNALNNTHGVNGGGANATNPFYCPTIGSAGATYPCNEASDQNWSRIVLTGQASSVKQGGQSQPTTTSSAYTYALTTLNAKECADCSVGMYWGNENDGDYLDYYNGVFMGFAEADVTNPDNSLTKNHFYSTNGYGIYDTSGQVGCFANYKPCVASPWWLPANALHGHIAEVDQYDVDQTTLLSKATTQYSVSCPANGVSGTPASATWGNWDGNLVSELGHNNPVASCAIRTTQTDDYTYDGATTGPHTTTAYAYAFDGAGHEQSVTATTSINGGTDGSPTSSTSVQDFLWNDALIPTSTGATGTYLAAIPYWSETQNTQGTGTACAATSYDGGVTGAGQQNGLTLAEATSATTYATTCGATAATSSGPLTTTNAYDTFGNPTGTSDADANAGIGGHTGCAVGGMNYTACSTYDTTYDALPVASANALNQTATSAYSQTAAAGWGTWPVSTTDPNGQTTSATYDALGRMTSRTLPGETAGDTTTAWTYTNWCASTGAQAPCLELDQTQRVNASTTRTTRAFYDGAGRLVEMRTPGPGGQDVIVFATYDHTGRQVFRSNPYFVAAYTGAPGSAAYSAPATQPGATTIYTNERTTLAQDALSHTTTTTASTVCGVGSDAGCYDVTTTVDPAGHQAITMADGLGRAAYDQTYTGTASPYTLYATTSYGYDTASDLVETVRPDGKTITASYDLAGRQTGMSDPDRGNESYAYDPNGNITQTTDARGASGTIYVGYDGLNRQVWRNTTNSATGAYVTYGYDSTANGNVGIGRLTGETFTNANAGGSLSGAYVTTYDSRGRVTATTETVGGSPYTTSATYNDTGQVTSQTYPNGDVLTPGLDSASGWQTALQVQLHGGVPTQLLSSESYTGAAGAMGLLTAATLGGFTSGSGAYAASYDALGRLTSGSYSYTPSGGSATTLYQVQPSYDALSNVIETQTTLLQGVDTQVFCYDDLSRLTWAGTTGTPGCSGAPTPSDTSSLVGTGAQYSATYAYDSMNHLTSAPLGSYTYGDSAHADAATAIGTSGSPTWSASYDAAGDMTCRAATSASTCAGSSPTGAQLTYDNQGQLAAWQNMPSSPTSSASFLYDGEGQRVEQIAITSGTSTNTTYIGSLEEIGTTGSTTTTTAYYGGLALSVNGALSYTLSDHLGSVSEAISTSGSVAATQLYAPYGSVRYSSGTLPGTLGYTGQHADATTGLDYYGARYYDPVAGQFTSADATLAGGLNRYAYVSGNPETSVDPTGHDDEPPDYRIGGPPPPVNPNNQEGTGPGGDGNPSSPSQPTTSTERNPSSPAEPTTSTEGSPSSRIETPDVTPSTRGEDGQAGTSVLQPGADGVLNESDQGRIEQYQNADRGAGNPPQAPGTNGGDGSTGSGNGATSWGNGGTEPFAGDPAAPADGATNSDIVDITLDGDRYPETAQHIEEAIANGQPDELTISRGDAQANRRASLKGFPTQPGLDRDEYPLAMTSEGGAGADIEYIGPSDNRGAGSTIGRLLGGYPDGTRFRIRIVRGGA